MFLKSLGYTEKLLILKMLLNSLLFWILYSSDSIRVPTNVFPDVPVSSPNLRTDPGYLGRAGVTALEQKEAA